MLTKKYEKCWLFLQYIKNNTKTVDCKNTRNVDTRKYKNEDKNKNGRKKHFNMNTFINIKRMAEWKSSYNH